MPPAFPACRARPSLMRARRDPLPGPFSSKRPPHPARTRLRTLHLLPGHLRAPRPCPFPARCPPLLPGARGNARRGPSAPGSSGPGRGTGSQRPGQPRGAPGGCDRLVSLALQAVPFHLLTGEGRRELPAWPKEEFSSPGRPATAKALTFQPVLRTVPGTGGLGLISRYWGLTGGYESIRNSPALSGARNCICDKVI